LIKAKLQQNNISLDDKFFTNVEKYKQHLMKWNKIHNISGAKDEATMDDFIYDSVFAVSFLPKVKNILDIGSGAGFPGMILALALPDTEVTLVEPLTKRASFLQYIKATLNLKNVKVVKKRVEEMPGESFELITSRAVTDTKMLLQISKNFTTKDTMFLFYKGQRVFEEVDNTIKHKIIQTDNRHYLLIGENL